MYCRRERREEKCCCLETVLGFCNCICLLHGTGRGGECEGRLLCSGGRGSNIETPDMQGVERGFWARWTVTCTLYSCDKSPSQDSDRHLYSLAL